MKSFNVLLILVLASLFAGEAEAKKKIFTFNTGGDSPFEQFAKIGAGKILDVTGVGQMAGVTHGGKAGAKVDFCARNTKGQEVDLTSLGLCNRRTETRIP